MSTTISGVRIVDMPDLGAFDDTSSIVGEKAGSGRFGATALSQYFLPISYAATGTPTKRTGMDRAADTVNVRDFGAQLDGTTDDMPFFQAARNTTIHGGSRIWVPRGKTVLGSNITIPTGSSTIWDFDAYTQGVGAPIDFNFVQQNFGTDIVHALNQGEWWYQYQYPAQLSGRASALSCALTDASRIRAVLAGR